MLVTPFVEAGLASASESRRLRLGARYDAWRALALEVAGERRENAAAETANALRFDLKLRF